jgi:hypothetical protein
MATKKKSVTSVVTVDPNASALVPAINYGEDFGSGLDDVGRDEAGIPFLKILQAQSPEVQGPNGKIDGAVAGMILNTGTGELLENVTIVPALRQHVFVEWRPRNQGGGIVSLHQPGTELVEAAIAENARAIEAGENSRKKAGKMKYGEFYSPDGNDLVETYYVYGVILDNDSPSGVVVIPFSSTSIAVYKKKFISRARYCMVDDGTGRKRNPPLFAHRVIIGTGQESNDSGSWFNPTITFAVDNNAVQSLMVPEHAGYIAGRELKTMIEGGELKADLNKAATTDGGGDAEDGDSAF